jgi:2-iminoacetate synthase
MTPSAKNAFMSFSKILSHWRSFDFTGFLNRITPSDIERIIAGDHLDERDFLALLSNAADAFLEPLAQKAAALTRLHFGNSIVLFTPLYISNYCTNTCRYCAFAKQHRISRKHLDAAAIRTEAGTIAASGMRHILLLTGEAPGVATLDYIAEAVAICREHFSSIGIEIYPLPDDGYRRLIGEGVDSLTIYQEVYDERIYADLHGNGPKSDYRFRLDAPERACGHAIHAVTVGALLGLHAPITESFFTGLHARYLLSRYPGTEISVAHPRLRPFAAEFSECVDVSDRQFVKTLIATRLFLPSAGITISTRESREFRNNILPLGVTKMSAGVSTAVGGHALDASTAQFEIADTRSVDEMKEDLLKRGFQPVMQDWNACLHSQNQPKSRAA